MFLVEKQKIPAHKNILSSRSEKFEKMFTGNFKESNQQIVEIPKMKAEIFYCKPKLCILISIVLLEYIYTDEVRLNCDTAIFLLKAADEYLIPRLKHICELFLIQHLKELDVIQVINLCEKHEANLLKKLAMKQLIKNINDLPEKTDLGQLPKSVLIDILKFELQCKETKKDDS